MERKDAKQAIQLSIHLFHDTNKSQRDRAMRPSEGAWRTILKRFLLDKQIVCKLIHLFLKRWLFHLRIENQFNSPTRRLHRHLKSSSPATDSCPPQLNLLRYPLQMIRFGRGDNKLSSSEWVAPVADLLTRTERRNNVASRNSVSQIEGRQT